MVEFSKTLVAKKKSQKCIRGGKSWGEKCCNFQQLMRRAACLVSIRCELRVKNSSQQCDKDVFNNGVNQYHSTHSASLTRVRRTCRWTTTKTQRCVTGRKALNKTTRGCKTRFRSLVCKMDTARLGEYHIFWWVTLPHRASRWKKKMLAQERWEACSWLRLHRQR